MLLETFVSTALPGWIYCSCILETTRYASTLNLRTTNIMHYSVVVFKAGPDMLHSQLCIMHNTVLPPWKQSGSGKENVLGEHAACASWNCKSIEYISIYIYIIQRCDKSFTVVLVPVKMARESWVTTQFFSIESSV